MAVAARLHVRADGSDLVSDQRKGIRVEELIAVSFSATLPRNNHRTLGLVESCVEERVQATRRPTGASRASVFTESVLIGGDGVTTGFRGDQTKLPSSERSFNELDSPD